MHTQFTILPLLSHVILYIPPPHLASSSSICLVSHGRVALGADDAAAGGGSGQVLPRQRLADADELRAAVLGLPEQPAVTGDSAVVATDSNTSCYAALYLFHAEGVCYCHGVFLSSRFLVL